MTKRNVALITGVRGQDGSHMADLLLKKGFEVVGLTRHSPHEFSGNISHLKDKMTLSSCSYDRKSLADLFEKVKPAHVYHFAGQSYVSKSWVMVEDTIQSIATLTSDLLEVAKSDRSIRFFNASSSEIFSPQNGELLTEDSPINPYNPYGCAKAFSHLMVRAYRQNYGMFCVNGILFPHESPRRNVEFLSKKLVSGAVKIKLKKQKDLLLGDLSLERDWGYAPEYMEAIFQMMSHDRPEDFVLATGVSTSVKKLVEIVFGELDLDFRDFVKTNPDLIRAYEVKVIKGSPKKAEKILGWKPKTSVEDVLKVMIDHEWKTHGQIR